MCLVRGEKCKNEKLPCLGKKKNEMIENNVYLNLLSYLYHIFIKIKFFIREKKLNLMLREDRDK